ncbi:interferon gamma 1-like [Oncorhynchus clarkii lewisi]|uniref:interferon gamma 1-like n=1 Tax=Oncorhynchus clarkii lewisi TaxID=490388 RepID=UPI0039B90F11
MNSVLTLVVVVWLGFCSVVVLGRPHHSGADLGARFVSENMEKDIKALEDPLKLLDTKLVGEPVFRNLMGELDVKFEKHEQWLLLNATLDVYLNIFSNMLKENHPEEVKQGLSRLRGKVEDLKRSYYQDRLKMKIQDLADIKTNDAVVQRKAVNEFKEVYQRASQLGTILHQRAKKVTQS